MTKFNAADYASRPGDFYALVAKGNVPAANVELVRTQVKKDYGEDAANDFSEQVQQMQSRHHDRYERSTLRFMTKEQCELTDTNRLNGWYKSRAPLGLPTMVNFKSGLVVVNTAPHCSGYSVNQDVPVVNNGTVVLPEAPSSLTKVDSALQTVERVLENPNMTPKAKELLTEVRTLLANMRDAQSLDQKLEALNHFYDGHTGLRNRLLAAGMMPNDITSVANAVLVAPLQLYGSLSPEDKKIVPSEVVQKIEDSMQRVSILSKHLARRPDDSASES